MSKTQAGNKPFYITTTLPYVNSDPHIGFAMELVRADVVARQKKLSGHEVFFNTGTDEHGLKIWKNAKAQGTEPQVYADGYAERFKALISTLGIMPEINFIRTTDEHHVKSAQAFWQLVDKNGYIYKKNYKVKYCVGCELEKTESELVDDKCPLHPLQELELIEEENYFFKFGAFGDKLLELYKQKDFVVPESRLYEIKTFVEKGIEDFSISRLSSKMPWGVPVPGDDSQVMYVWFDALVNYISAIGWPDNAETFKKWHVDSGGMVQYCGKDNLRQQSAMWQAMLMAAGLPSSRTIVIDGFVTGEGGVKMSKSLGNTVDPFDLVREYGVDAVRYFLVRELSPFEDSPFTREGFKDAYNAHLANGLGNLVSRVMKMATTNEVKFDESDFTKISSSDEVKALCSKQSEGFNGYNLKQASDAVWELVSNTDRIVQEREPFKKIKTDKPSAVEDIKELMARLRIVGEMLLPIMPATAQIIIDLVEGGKMPEQSLFVRK